MFTSSSIIDNLNQSEGLEYKKLCKLLKLTKKSDKDKLDIALTALEKLEIINKNNDNEYYWGTEFQLLTEKHMVYSGNDFWASDCNIVTADLKPNNLPYTLSSTGHCLMHEHSRLKMDYGGTHGGGNFTISIAVTAQF